MIRAPTPRKVTHVAVGVMVRDDGAVLLADRPEGKPYAGYWEFPGGKIEPGEPVAQALKRELHEELGIDIEASAPWVTFEFDYPHAYVRLHFQRVHRWRGEPHAREGQQLQFVHLAGELPQPLLPAAIPALRWLRLPETVLVVSPDTALPTDGGGTDRCLFSSRPLIVVVDTDWRKQNQAAEIARWRHFASGVRDLLLATGPGASKVAGTDGAVLESRALGEVGCERAATWRGLWIDRLEQVRIARRLACDFILLRRPAATMSPLEEHAAVPWYFAAPTEDAAASSSARAYGHGLWCDLRVQTRSTG